jgi:hypothetical protein
MRTCRLLNISKQLIAACMAWGQLACGIVLIVGNTALGQQVETKPLISLQPDGKLAYVVDEKGDRVPDFSYCGYRGGDQSIPLVAAVIFVPWKNGDATRRIQAAIDHVASLPLHSNGFRGAVLLDRGKHTISGGLTIKSSGIVLRGSGMGPEGTHLVGTGETRETLIRIAGGNVDLVGEKISVVAEYVPVNSVELRLPDQHGFAEGDSVFVRRPATQAWIDALGMNEFGGETGWIGWKPGQRELTWDREIIAVKGAVITLDAPLTTALEKKYGGGTVAKYRWSQRIQNVGIENIQCSSTYDATNLKDEQHRWMAVTMENVADAWVRQVVFRHFAGSAVAVLGSAKRVTVEDCKSVSPVSEIGGQRRYTFYTEGQQTLFQRLYAEYGYHDFAVGFCAAGPNAFVLCESYLPYSFSGTIDSWASGVLFDMVQVDGNTLGFQNRGPDAQGAGWTAANSVLWQCSASRIDCYRPPTANNYAFGAWAQFAGDGYWWEPNSHVKPRSLYYAQLTDRIGKAGQERSYLLPQETEASSSPTVEQALMLTMQASKRDLQLKDWIDLAPERQPLRAGAQKISNIDNIMSAGVSKVTARIPVQVADGKLVREGALLAGGRMHVPWWRGDIRPFAAEKARPHVTRFVPGKTGRGLTDDLDEVTEEMKQNHLIALEHNYGLWYDRRRDDHERVRRMNGEVWPPFYELPFARSGQGTAWDGLSKYDLTRYNTWYWNRLHAFATRAEQKGLLLIHHHYFQHNVLEAGAHYADFPWRTANNINSTGFAEPPPYAGDKRIFLAEQFYDITHPERKKLHREYIRKCLENFADNTNVIHLLSEEYTGPLHFARFWLDVIQEWEKETGHDAIIGLSVTKDVQDAILKDEHRKSLIDLIDIRYWHYRQDESVYAPKGGQNLAPRQHARLVKPGKSSFAQVFKAVHEYRQRNPDKVVIYSASGNDEHGWAVLMAGGSLPAYPSVGHEDFLNEIAGMIPVVQRGASAQWILQDAAKSGFVVYSKSTHPIQLDLRNTKDILNARWIDPASGQIIKEVKVQGGELREFKSPKRGDIVLWLSSNGNLIN